MEILKHRKILGNSVFTHKSSKFRFTLILNIKYAIHELINRGHVMKLKLHFLFLSFIIGATGNVFAQENYFTVLAAQGDILLQKTGETKMVDIKTGNNINPGEQINVGKNAYISLVYSNGMSIEIKKDGVYDFDRLKNSINNNYKSPDKKFTGYVISELTKKATESREMKSMGAVVRVRTNYIETGIPSSSLVIDSTLVFKWFSHGNTNHYIFKLINSSGVTLFMKEITDTTIDCPIYLFHLNKNENYKWIVFDYSNPGISTDTNFIMIPAPYKLEAIRDSIKELNANFGNDSTAVSQIIYASFYQDNELNFEALKAYARALRSAPDVDIYRKMFTAFLLKTKLYRMVDYSSSGEK